MSGYIPWRDDVTRLGEIREAHPEMELRPHVPFAPWRARIALPDGKWMVIVADGLGPFCDVLEVHFAPDDKDRVSPLDEEESRDQ